MGKTVAPFVRNQDFLKKHVPGLLKVLQAGHPEILKYEISPAKNGRPTLAILDGDRRVQVLSKYDPEKEAVQQIRQQNFLNPRILIIFGFGLGYHIRAALRELKDNMYLIVIERDPNLLLEAMRHVDLTDIFSSTKIFWMFGLAESEAYFTLYELIKSANTTFQLQLKAITAFEHPIQSQFHGEYYRFMLKQFREAVNHTILNYGNCPEDSLMGVENIMKNIGVIITNPGVQDLYGAFKGVPGLLVSTGPSLDRNIKHLIGTENRCVMIAADSAVWPLLRAGVTPHAFASLERVLETVETYKTIPEEKMQEIYLAATPVIRPEGYAAWKGPTIITYRDFAHFRWLDIPKGTLQVGMSCSNMAFKILEAMGCNPIILVGQDCAFESIERTHASGTRGRLINPLKQQQLYKIKGNFEEWVMTDLFFDLFRKAFVTDVANTNARVINCTAGGAFIEGTELMPLEKAVAEFCTRDIMPRDIFRQKLRPVPPDEVKACWRKIYRKILDTLDEVKKAIAFCDAGVLKVDNFEKALSDGGFTQLEDFLSGFPDDRINAFHDELNADRQKFYKSGQNFQHYLMHIIQMILIRFEMDFNSLPSMCNDAKRCKLQAVRLMKQFYPTIRDVCKISLKLLEDSLESLTVRFGKPEGD